MKYITRPPGLFIAIVFLTTITVVTASTTAVAAASPSPPCPPQSASLPDPASTAAAINAATQALQATNITSQLAITSSKEMMEKNKAYYEEMTTKLLWAAGVFAFFVTVGGPIVVWMLTRQRVNKMARKAVTTFRTEFDGHITESRTFHEATRKFRDETTANLQGFILFTPAFNQLTAWCSSYGHLEALQRPDAKLLIERSLKTCKQVLDLKPTDGFLLGLTYSVKSVALSLDNKLQGAYDACKESLKHHPDQASPLYNMACIAARLTRHDEAKQHLHAAIGIEPHRAQQAAGDGDFASLLRDAEFRIIVALPPIPEE